MRRGDVLGFANSLGRISTHRLVWVKPKLHARAMTLLAMHRDKNYSLCDAVSFVLMRHFAMTEALTTDHHFEQAGFVRLLRP